MRLDVTNILGAAGSTAISFSGTTLSFPSQPCFSAETVSATKAGSAGGRILRYETVLVNIGNGYNSANGRFTAPQQGLYFIGFNLVVSSSTFRNLSFIQKNGVAYLEATQEQTPGSGQIDRILAASCLIYLNVNDYVEIAATADTAANAGWNTFSGYYIGT